MLHKLLKTRAGKLAVWALSIFTGATVVTALVRGTVREEELTEADIEEERIKEQANKWGIQIPMARYVERGFRALGERQERIFASWDETVAKEAHEGLIKFYEELLDDISKHPPADYEEELIAKVRESMAARIEERRRSTGGGKNPMVYAIAPEAMKKD